MVNNNTPFTMVKPNAPFLGKSLRSTAVLAALFTFGTVQAQCCGRQAPRPGGAFELGAGGMALGMPDGPMHRLQLDMAWFGAGRTPLKSGIRMGLTAIGSAGLPLDGDAGAGPDDIDRFQYRSFLPALSGVLRFDPLRGGFRPFVEGEFGLAASMVDRRSINTEGDRVGYRLEAFEPTVGMGWSAGTRIRLGRSAFLVMRYGEQQGGSLPHYDPAAWDAEAVPMEATRRQATLGFSFGR